MSSCLGCAEFWEGEMLQGGLRLSSSFLQINLCCLRSCPELPDALALELVAMLLQRIKLGT